MWDRKSIFWYIVAVVAIISILVGTYLVQQNQNPQEKAAPASSLFISPAVINTRTGDTTSFSVSMNTGSNLVTGVDVKLNFNPNAFEVLSLERGSGVPSFDQTVDTQIGFNNITGTISYAIFTLDKTKYVTGNNIQVLKVNVKAKNSVGTSAITFASNTSAAAINEDVNIIANMTSGNIVITQPTASPSPTPTKSPSPTPTKSPSPTPTASPTASPSPTPTKSPSPSPSPTASPRRPGDVTGDGIVNILDIRAIIEVYMTEPPANPWANLNPTVDNIVNIIDIGIVITNYDL